MFNKYFNEVPEYFVCILALVLGLIYLKNTPPFQIPDENAHFERAYHVSRGYVKPTVINDSLVGGILPHDVTRLINKFCLPYRFNPMAKYNKADIQEELAGKYDTKADTFTNLGHAIQYPPIAYYHQALAIKIGEILNFSMLRRFQATRFSNLLVSVFILFFAIRIIPIGKWGIAFIAFLPMSVYLRSSCSQDAIALSLAALLLARYFRYLIVNETRIGWKNIIADVVLVFLFMACKIAYLPLCLLYLILPQSKYENRAIFLIRNVLILSLIFLIPFLWIKYVSNESNVYYQGTPVAGSIMYFFQEPIEFLSRIFRSLSNNQMSSFYYQSFVGILGWLDTYLPMNIYYIIAFVFILIAFVFSSSYSSFPYIKWIIVMIALLNSFLIFLPMVKETEFMVSGVQGRYFLPFSYLLLFMLPKIKILERDIFQKVTNYVVLATILYIHFTTINSLNHRFYF